MLYYRSTSSGKRAEKDEDPHIGHPPETGTAVRGGPGARDTVADASTSTGTNPQSGRGAALARVEKSTATVRAAEKRVTMTDARGSARRDGEAPVRHAPGTPCWVSLMVHGPAAARTFYEALFGWEFRPGPHAPGPYARALLDGREVAGIGLLPADLHLPVAWTPYFASADVDRTAETVRSCGGTIGVGPLDAAEAGRMAIGSDPSGAVFGIWQASARLGGPAVTGVPGAPAWHELTTRESERVAKFYTSVFGHTAQPEVSTDLDYVTLSVEGRPVAGIHGVGNGLLRDRGPHWTTHFTVADVDDAVDHVLHLGGQVLKQAGAGAHGRVATVTDPEGARFSLVQHPQ